MSNLYKEVCVGSISKYEHRIIAEQLIGRELKQQEDVHHKDNNKNNNDKDNLIVFVSRSAHISFHHGGSLIPTNEPYVYDCVPLQSKCMGCGCKLHSRHTKTSLCIKCLGKKQRKVKDRPTHKKLLDLLNSSNYCAVAKMYGVSDNTIRKWLKSPE